RLVEGGDIGSLDWLENSPKPGDTQVRGDRFVAAFNFFGTNLSPERRAGKSQGAGNDGGDNAAGNAAPGPAGETGQGTTPSGAYIVRAVTPGTFVHPAATVEDMYRPERYARSAAGKLTVTAKD